MDFSRAFDPFRALRSAWSAVRQAPVPLLLGGILLAVSSGGGGGFGNPAAGVNLEERGGELDWEALLPVFAALGAVSCCVALALFLFSSWIEIGFNHAVSDVVRTGRGDVGAVFDARGRYLDMLLARFYAGLVQVALVLPFALVVGALAWAAAERALPEEALVAVAVLTTIVVLVLVVYVQLGLAFVAQAVALEGLRPIDALGRSWQIARGHRWQLLLYWIVLIVFTLLGFCLCCIGVLFTSALARVAATESYLAWTRGDERPGWWIESGAVAPETAPGSWGVPPPPPPPPFTPPAT